MRRIAIAVLCLVGVGGVLMSGCGTSAVHSVDGTVSRVDGQAGNFGQREKRFILLKGSDTLYECWVEVEPSCSVVREGDQLTLMVGHNEDYDLDNYVVSVTIGSRTTTESP